MHGVTLGVAATGLAAALACVYVRLIRPRQIRWGATNEELARAYPYDELFAHPDWSATRAVTVAARPEQIWPFIVRIGWGRAGWYGYDLIDNGGKPSTWEVLPEHQDLEIGRKFPLSPFTAVFCVDFEEFRWMLWRGPNEAGTWLWYLDPIDECHTRLITRMRNRYNRRNPAVLAAQIAVELADLPFMRKCLLGIKARAERIARFEASAHS
jgi:hypothetical protein